MAAKLKPCPFCGCAYEKDDDDLTWAGNHAEWCPLSAKWPSNMGNVLVIDDEELIERWNRRMPDIEYDPYKTFKERKAIIDKTNYLK